MDTTHLYRGFDGDRPPEGCLTAGAWKILSLYRVTGALFLRRIIHVSRNSSGLSWVTVRLWGRECATGPTMLLLILFKWNQRRYC